MEYLSVSEVADKIGVPPRIVTDLFYLRRLNVDICPIMGGRRLIPPAYVGEIERVLRERGHLKEVATT